VISRWRQAGCPYGHFIRGAVPADDGNIMVNTARSNSATGIKVMPKDNSLSAMKTAFIIYARIMRSGFLVVKK